MLRVLLFFAALSFTAAMYSFAQPTTAGTISGTITDPTGAAIPGAAITILQPVTRYLQNAVTNNTGAFRLANIPHNNYHVTITAPGFQPYQTDVNVRSSLPVELQVTLKLGTEETTVEVHSEASDILESIPTVHTDIDSNLVSKLPVARSSTGLSDVLTLGTPGVVADSNGMFHPLGEHADTTIQIDNQPITDQISRGFSNQMALNAIQSLEVISGVPPAEYGDKAGLIVNANTRSSLGQAKPNGSVGAQYGSFGTWGGSATLGVGGAKWGNFLSVNGSGSGRFLDSPEFSPLHDHGNSENIFDRFDFQPTAFDTLHLNLGAARSWFQVPNTYSQQFAGQDQRQWVRTLNAAPGWSHLFSTTTLMTVNPFVRQDLIRYVPSRETFSDLPATVGQQRRLTNAGIKAGVSYVKGAHNARAGVQVSHTFLSENFQFGITDPAFNPVCLTAGGTPVTAPSPVQPAGCAASGYLPNPDVQAGLIPYDLTRGGQLFRFRGHADIKQEALFLQDAISLGRFTVNAGLRGDVYRGLSKGSALEPRIGLSYLIKPSNTVLRAAYGRLFETPYNENLVLSSSTGAGGLASNVFGAYAGTALRPGKRNQFNLGIQQAAGRYAVLDANYFWKFTRNAFDFDTLFNTPITFPIEWRKSKIDGLSLRLNLVHLRGLTAYTEMGHTRARFFGPETGGLIFNSPLNTGVFRIDHDQLFEQTTHVQYQYGKSGPWVAFTWRYDSGMVAGSVPDFASALALTGEEQAQMGLHCGDVFATFYRPITSCSQDLGATRIRIPPAGTANQDTNPPRIAPRHLFDAGFGIDDLFHTEHPRWALRLTGLNLTNKVALYNFLSTFSGTHFVPPRTWQAEMELLF